MPQPRWWDEIKRMTEWGHEWSSCRTDGLHLLLKKDLMFLDKVARWAGQNSGEYLQPSQRSPVLQIWWGENWFLSPIFSHFKPYWSILLCSFLSFFFLPLSALEEKDHLFHNGTVFWTSHADGKLSGFCCHTVDCLSKGTGHLSSNGLLSALTTKNRTPPKHHRVAHYIPET